jgi:hypothetical protein
MSSLATSFNTTGISAFGLSMPILSPNWTVGALPTVNEANMSLSVPAETTWCCPAAGTLLTVDPNPPQPDPLPEDPAELATALAEFEAKRERLRLRIPLIRPNGSVETGPGVLLTLFPQLFLRLSRLYAQVLQDADPARPERNRGLPVRPVPRYFFFAGPVTDADTNGNLNPNDDLGREGTLTIYDETGHPIDPLAVVSAFVAIINRHQILQQRPIGVPFDPDYQLEDIAALAGTPITRVRLADHAGVPRNSDRLTGLTAVNAGNGLFTLSGSIAKETASDSFPEAVRRLIVLGPATTGRMGDQFTPPALPGGVTLERDFFSMRVLDLKPTLLGTPDPAFDGTRGEDPPPIRLNEPLQVLTDGNDVLAAANLALLGADAESLSVAQDASSAFDVPEELGPGTHWPVFPPSAGGDAAAGALPIDLRDDFAPTAAYFDDGDPARANTDVILTLNGLPAGAAVRVFARKFVSDAREERGDGGGGIVPPGTGGDDTGGPLVLLLRDPFNLRKLTTEESAIFVPVPATLRCDVMVVKRTGEARMYGNVSAEITTTTTTPAPPPVGTNPFATAARRSVSRSGILGLRGRSIPPGASVLDAVLATIGEGTPRDPPRLPSMARRDLIAAGVAGGNWRATLAAGRLTDEALSADARLGSPGGSGGRETRIVGLRTQNGPLAYDLARMAFRRTTNIVSRMAALADATWAEPNPLPPLPAGTAASDTGGTIAGAVLQTIAPFCETPELNLLKSVVTPVLGSLPTTFDDLVDFVTGSLVPGGIPFRTEIINQLNSLKGNPAGTRLYTELKREVMSACFGRRDAQWALRGAIQKARRFIYIETPGLAATRRDYGADSVPPHAVDLFAELKARLAENPGLHVIICTPKFPDFADGYEPLAAHEADARRGIILGPPGEALARARQIVSFHPVGFPGRPSRLETTVVVVDDVWALVGSSTLRRRGLTFDGGSDVVFTDLDLVSGRSPTISAFRRKLLADHLGVTPTLTTEFGTMPDPRFVRLRDGVESFHLIRETLVAGGLGKIERLWNGELPGVTKIDTSTVPLDRVNPEGLEFSLAEALIAVAAAGLSAA